MRIPAWIVRNVTMYKNCYLPTRLVQVYGKEAVAEELSKVLGNRIFIKEIVFKNLDGNNRFRREKGYIAEYEKPVQKK